MFIHYDHQFKITGYGRVIAMSKQKEFVEESKSNFVPISGQDLWQFQPVNGTKNHFRLINMKYEGEELYASDREYNGRREVYAKKPQPLKENIDKFVWVFKPLENNVNSFNIVNKAYGDILYAGSYWYSRRLMTWWDSNIEAGNGQSVWTLDCSFTEYKNAEFPKYGSLRVPIGSQPLLPTTKSNVT